MAERRPDRRPLARTAGGAGDPGPGRGGAHRGGGLLRRPRLRSNGDAERRPRIRVGPGLGGPGAPPGRGSRLMGGAAPKRVAVIGGGVTGLVAAYRLLQTSNGTPIEVMVF